MAQKITKGPQGAGHDWEAGEHMLQQEAKPCPFCGSTDLYHSTDAWSGDISIHCQQCSQGAGESLAEAIQAWNKRVPHGGDHSFNAFGKHLPSSSLHVPMPEGVKPPQEATRLYPTPSICSLSDGCGSEEGSVRLP